MLKQWIALYLIITDSFSQFNLHFSYVKCERTSFDIHTNLELQLIVIFYKLLCNFDYEFSNVLCSAYEFSSMKLDSLYVLHQYELIFDFRQS